MCACVCVCVYVFGTLNTPGLVCCRSVRVPAVRPKTHRSGKSCSARIPHKFHQCQEIIERRLVEQRCNSCFFPGEVTSISL